MIIRAITKGKKGYKVYFEEGRLLILTFHEDSYQGISHWADYWGINDLDIEEGHIFGEKIINYPDLPSIIKSQVEYVLYKAESN